MAAARRPERARRFATQRGSRMEMGDQVPNRAGSPRPGPPCSATDTRAMCPWRRERRTRPRGTGRRGPVRAECAGGRSIHRADHKHVYEWNRPEPWPAPRPRLALCLAETAALRLVAENSAQTVLIRLPRTSQNFPGPPFQNRPAGSRSKTMPLSPFPHSKYPTASNMPRRLSPVSVHI